MKAAESAKPIKPVSREMLADRIVLGLIVLGLIAFALHNIVAYDVWWQLKAGQLVRTTGWPATDPFSYGFPGHAWIELRWLYAVVVSLIFEIAGPNSLIGAKLVWLFGVGAVLFSIGKPRSVWAINLGLLAALMVMHQRFVIRPELVSYAFIAVTLLFLRRYQIDNKRYWLYPLPLIQILWVNSHTLYAIGPIILWIFAAAEFGSRFLLTEKAGEPNGPLNNKALIPLVITAAAMTAACLINPYGLQGALFAVQLFSQIQTSHVLNDAISELRSPFDAPSLNILFVSYVGLIVVSAAGFFLHRRELSAGWLALWAAFAYLSFVAERNLPLFAIVASVSIIINFSGVSLPKNAIWAIRGLCAAILLVMIPMAASNYYYRQRDPDRRFGTGIAVRRFPVSAMEFVKTQSLPLPVLSNIAESSYVLFDQGPGSVYIDGRLEVYGGPAVEESVRTFSSAADLTSTADRLGVSTFVARHDGDPKLVVSLLSDPVWTAVYFDESHIVFLKNVQVNEPLIARLKIDWNTAEPHQIDVPAGLAATNLLARLIPSVADDASERALGQLFLAAGSTIRGQQYLERAIAKWPDDPAASLPLGLLYRAQGREADAVRLLGHVPPELLNSRDMQARAATLYEQFENSAAASDAWAKVVAAGDTTTEVYQHLAESSIKAQRWENAYRGLKGLADRTPNDTQVFNNLGAVAEKTDRRPEALAAFARSLQINPAQPQILTQIGVLKARNGDTAGARTAFEQALAIDPSFESARKGLEMLGKR